MPANTAQHLPTYFRSNSLNIYTIWWGEGEKIPSIMAKFFAGGNWCGSSDLLNFCGTVWIQINMRLIKSIAVNCVGWPVNPTPARTHHRKADTHFLQQLSSGFEHSV